MRALRLGISSLLAASVAFAASGCADKPPTAIVLAIQADVAVPDEVDTVELTVSREGGSNTVFYAPFHVSHTSDGSTVRLPGTLTFDRADAYDLSDPVTFEVRALVGPQSAPKVLRRATLTFQEGRTKLLRMPLTYSCYEFPNCPTGTTCKGGVCQAEVEPVEQLPDADDRVREAFASDQACFQVAGDKGCFKDAVTVFDFSGVDANCELELPNVGGGNLNVSLQWDKAGSRYRFSPNAYEPNTPPEALISGWQFASGSTTRVKLGSQLCASIRGQGNPGAAKPVALRYASDCAPNLNAPPCPVDVAKTAATFEESLCYQCVTRPPKCGAFAQKARASEAKGYLDCLGDRPLGKDGGFQAGACLAEARVACMGKIDAACAASLDAPGCAAKYAALKDYLACVDTENGGIGDGPAADLLAGYTRCKAVCDSEGFGKACVTP